MARLIVKSPYIKCGTGQSAGGYLKYIATRERVETIPDDRPPTNKQTQLIAKLVKDMPYLFVKSSVALNLSWTGTRSTGF